MLWSAGEVSYEQEGVQAKVSVLGGAGEDVGPWQDETETIAAVATPTGMGGIAIVRLSGPRAIEVAEGMVWLRRRRNISSLQTWSCALGDVFDPASGVHVDEAVIVVMRAPRSYTGEDVVEVQCHGGRLVAEKVLSLALSLGARLAMPGEFTRRAFLNGRITLEEAEAVLDIVTATTESSLAQARRRLKGELGSMVGRWEKSIVGILAQLEGAADFPEDIDAARGEVVEEVRKVRDEIDGLLKRAPLGLALTQGIEVCIVGRPNVGKSSLFNALLAQERAIVTDIPGTTRDVLRERTEWQGLPVILLDTAGLRDTREIVEAMGVERAKSAAEESEVILYVVDDSEGLLNEDIEWLRKWQDRRVIVAVNKTDIGRNLVTAGELEPLVGHGWVRVSGKTGSGVSSLKEKVAGLFTRGGGIDEVLPGSARQVDCLRRAKEALSRVLSDLEQGWTEDVIVLSLEEAARALLELTGRNVSEETLNEIFSRFCVGK
ncbi:MAG: tRNA uridine-5-carboxymethylaminomethyl(34) synthesis GTPase MnmE [Candidatus Fermentithermobacillus carboniphilus]|uniref:tRNA modification GTPase MnmE n=1 Tax=Candidatus Fermentithermobacillus carboniphilus TaxID=3085328 RepID=A0AAT9LCC9_9FIRM|nr:MAG: tRNA uridine-5-carboxymethylaminomethyl(34) synthesis GTPase MnmE [Candidatus Fermentithermobacillus carboniphilus]